MDTSELSERFAVMIKQENSSYNRIDYLKQCKDSHAEKNVMYINAKCRDTMADWCYQVIDFCNFHRDTAGIAISYLDSFLSTREGNFALTDTRNFQLAAMCSLELAIKLTEPQKVDMNFLIELSKRSFSVAELAEMERKILTALDWRMNPPMPLDFALHFLELLSQNMHSSVKDALLKFTRIQTEYASRNYSFISYKPSLIGFVSVLNAIDAAGIFSHSETATKDFCRDVIFIFGINPSEASLHDVRTKLQKSMEKVTGYDNKENMKCNNNTSYLKQDATEHSASPVCVSEV